MGLEHWRWGPQQHGKLSSLKATGRNCTYRRQLLLNDSSVEGFFPFFICFFLNLPPYYLAYGLFVCN